MIKISSDNIYLAFTILVGGKSRRFGEDKGLFKINDKTLIEYQIETLKKFRFDIFIVAHSKEQVQSYINKVNYKLITGFILDDTEELVNINVRSPMIGLYSAFKELKDYSYKKIFAISCDMPLIQPDVIEFLIEQSYNYDSCLPIWKNGYIEPLFAIYPIEKGLESARNNLIKKKFKLTNLIKNTWNLNYISIEKQIKIIDSDLLTFININRIKDLNNIKDYFSIKYNLKKK